MIEKQRIRDLYNSLVLDIRDTLDAEFDAGRLKNDEYRKALTALMSHALQQAVVIASEEGLKEAQIEQIKAETAIKEAQSDKDLLLKDKQIDSINADIALRTAQKDKTLSDKSIAEAQSAKDLVLKDKQLDKYDAEIASDNQRVTSMQIDDTIKQAQSAKDLAVKDKQIEKLTKDIALEEEQILTQQNDRIIKTAQSNKDLEVKTAQKELYIRQKEGFDDNARQKLLETQFNAFAMVYSSGMMDASATWPSALDGSQLSSMYDKIYSRV